MAVVVSLQVFIDTCICHECVSLVRNRNNQVQCLFPKPINFQAEKNSSCPTFETVLRGVVAPTARKERASGWMAHRKYVRMLPSRSGERRVGEKCVSTWNFRGWPYHLKKNHKHIIYTHMQN